MTGNQLGDVLTRRQRFAILGGDHPYPLGGNRGCFTNFDVEELGVDAVPTRQQKVDLWPFLPASLEEALGILEFVVPLHAAPQQPARGNGRAASLATTVPARPLGMSTRADFGDVE